MILRLSSLNLWKVMKNDSVVVADSGDMGRGFHRDYDCGTDRS